MKTETKYKLALFLIGVVLVWVLLTKCSSDVKPTANNHDSIYHTETIDNNIIELTLRQNKYLKRINDSLLARKPIYVIRIKTKFDSLYITDTSCQNSLIVLYNSFGELNDLNDSIIANNQKRLVNDSITIATLTHKVGLKQSHITIDSARIVQLTDTLKTVKRKGFIKGFEYGFVSGAIVTEGVNVGDKFIK